MYGAPMSVTPKASYSKMMRDFQRQHGGVHKNRTIATVILLLLIPTFFLLRGGMGPMNCGVASHFPGSTAPRGSRIAMAAFSTNAASYLFLVLKNRYHYAKRHGYDVYFDYEAEGDRGPTWHKFNMVERLIKHGGYDWIWFLDLDALITNTDVQLTSVIADALATAARPSDVDLIINDDWYAHFTYSNNDKYS
jgi:mannan polymerase II complex MNN10 subunit